MLSPQEEDAVTSQATDTDFDEGKLVVRTPWNRPGLGLRGGGGDVHVGEGGAAAEEALKRMGLGWQSFPPVWFVLLVFVVWLSCSSGFCAGSQLQQGGQQEQQQLECRSPCQ